LQQKTCLTFGWLPRADVSATEVTLDPMGHPRFNLVTQQGQIAIHLPLLGKHNVSNALACAAAALAVGLPLTAIKQGLESVTAVTKRLVEHVKNQVRIIDDTYNANPASVSAAIDVLQATPSAQKILVLGKMGELGVDAEKFHAQIGSYAKKAGIDLLYACGDLTLNAVNAFGDNGFYYATQEELTAAVQEKITAGVTILVKGSRSASMEKVVQALLPIVEN